MLVERGPISDHIIEAAFSLSITAAVLASDCSLRGRYFVVGS